MMIPHRQLFTLDELCILMKIRPGENSSLYFEKLLDYIKRLSYRIESGDLHLLKHLSFLIDLHNTRRGRNKDHYNDTSISPISIYSAIIEAAQHFCCNQKDFDLLTHELQDVIHKNITRHDTPRVSCMLLFLQYLDKVLMDRISEWSTLDNTSPSCPIMFEYLYSNRFSLRQWAVDNQLAISQVSLIAGDPANCWRIIVQRIYQLNKSGFSFDKPEFGDISDPNFTEEPEMNIINGADLKLLMKSARQLKDLDLLRGIRSLMKSKADSDYLALKLTISNLEGNYTKTRECYLRDNGLTQDETIEFFDACHALGCLNDQFDKLYLWRSRRFGKLYKLMNETKTTKESDKRKVGDLAEWMTNWTYLTLYKMDEDFKELIPIRDYNKLIKPFLQIHKDDSNISRLLSNIQYDETDIPMCYQLASSNQASKFQLNDLLLDKVITNNGLKLEKSEEEKLLHEPKLCYDVYRAIQFSGCTEEITSKDRICNKLWNNIKLKAEKFLYHINAHEQATNIAESFFSDAKSTELIRGEAFILSVTNQKDLDEREKLKNLVEFSGHIHSRPISDCGKRYLWTKILCKLLKSPYGQLHLDEFDSRISMHDNNKMDYDDGVQHISFISKIKRWEDVHNGCQSEDLKCKVLLLIKAHYAKLSEPLKEERSKMFWLDRNLLIQLSQSKAPKYRSHAIDTVLCILEGLKCALLDCDSGLGALKLESFYQMTGHVWLSLRTIVISALFSDKNMPQSCRDALRDLILLMVKKNPELFLYQCIVNRLELRNQIRHHKKEEQELQESCSVFLQHLHRSECINSLAECQQQLSFWNDVYTEILQNGSCWSDIAQQTEVFVKEIRRIAYLPAEHLKLILLRINKEFKTLSDTNEFSIESARQKFRVLSIATISDMQSVLTYCDWIEKNPAQTSVYDSWFLNNPAIHIRALHKLLVSNLEDKCEDFPALIKIKGDVIERIQQCYGHIVEITTKTNQKLYMAMLSPILSKFVNVGKFAMMPIHHLLRFNLKKSYNKDMLKEEPIFVHKIKQPVPLINSKTNPKKITLVGSNGESKSFCLKSQDDLRLDATFMDLFELMNIHFEAKRETRDRCSLRHYSVVPIGTSAGLIEWIEASSSFKFIADRWLLSENGQRFCDQFFKSTCESICISDTDGKHHCQAPDAKSRTSFQLFYQLLWAKSRPSLKEVTTERPCQKNIAAYRREFNSTIFEQVSQELINRLPQDLIAQRIWYRSVTSYDYWLKTRAFSRSCGTSSMMGYILGIGDRHPGNILLDEITGEVIHIDLNVCFDQGEQFSRPELVPFRLTESMVTAFGYAGLEGPFRQAMKFAHKLIHDKRNMLKQYLSIEYLLYLNRSRRLIHTHSSRESQDIIDKRDSNVESIMFGSEPSITDQHMLPRVNFQRSQVESKDLQTDCSREPIIINECECFRCKAISVDESTLANRRKSDRIGSIKTVCDLEFEKNPVTQANQDSVKVLRSAQERMFDKIIGNDNKLIGLKSNDVNDTDIKNLNDSDMSSSDLAKTLIQIARSTKRMSRMYEGWLPWN